MLPPKSLITEVMEIETSQLAPSPTNPRTNFPASHIEQIAASIKATRQVQAGVVRPWTATAEDVQLARAAGLKPKFGPGDDMYQVVIGGCRARACAEVGVRFRAEVREMTDEEVMIEQRIENLRRKDLDPMEEAQGFRDLLDKGMTLQRIAETLGDEERSIQYISAVQRLTLLTDEGKELLKKGWTSRGHAILVARLEPEDQERSWRAVFDFYGQRKKQSVLQIAEEIQNRDFADYQVLTEKALREWIKNNINLQLKKAPWDLSDAELYPEAGPCTTCPFKTGNNQALFAEISIDGNECIKPECYQEKGKRYVKITMENAADVNTPLLPISVKTDYHSPKEGQKVLKQGQWLPSKKGECKSTEAAILVDSEDRGQTTHVCADGNCKKHPHNWHDQQQASGLQGSGAPAQTTSNGGTMFDPEELRRQQEQADAERKAAVAVEEEIVLTVLRAELKRTNKPDEQLLRRLAEEQMRIFDIDPETICMALGLEVEGDPVTALMHFIDKANVAQLSGVLSLQLLGDTIYSNNGNFGAMAFRNKINLSKLRKELEKKHAPKAPAASPAVPKRATEDLSKKRVEQANKAKFSKGKPVKKKAKRKK
ncbi:MAG TPA: ParB N-terminal domain-containing protein [Candidatus Angelobacter sp.]|jgi:ParB/RepB/Spo0J family partition protein